jgi:predicted Rossmann-fold nucleotide-binding protein
LRKYRLPHDVFDFINFTGMNYVGRDLYLVQSSDAIITVGGRFGSLHEFTSALEAHKPCGVLLGSGGTADLIPDLMQKLQAPHDDLVVYDTDPKKLVEKMIAILDKEYKDVIAQLKRDEHWYLRRDLMQSPPPRAG